MADVTRIAAWISDRIHEHAPGPDRGTQLALDLAIAARALAVRGGMVFGMMYPAALGDPTAVLQHAVATLHQWLPLLDPRELAVLAEIATDAKLVIDTAPYVANAEAAAAAAKAAKRATRASGEPRNAELERALQERPEDPTGYSVLADWLEEQGSPRGELIHLALRAESDPSATAMVTAHLAAHRDALVGSLADAADSVQLTWHRGFIRGARLSSDASLAPLLEMLLQHPSARWLDELAIGMSGEVSDFDLGEVLDVLVAERPPSLRTLHLGDFEYPEDCELSWYEVGDTSALWPTLPGLRKLTIQGGSFTLGTLDLPALEHAEFRTGGLTTESALAINRAKLPKLERLDIWYGGDAYGGTATFEDLLTLLGRRDLPALRHLGLINCAITSTVCAELARSPLLAQLYVLDLSMGTLGDEGARVILAHRSRFAGLQRLDVSQTYVSEEVLAELRDLGPWLIADEMHEPADVDDRYVTVGE